MSVIAFGLHHRSTPLALLERVVPGRDERSKLLVELCRSEHIDEAVALTTCNRIEIYVEADRFHGSFQDVRDALARIAGLDSETVGDYLLAHYEHEAVSHLFEVAAGLDSAVLGEHEILGQVRGAWEEARDEGSCGSALDLLFRHAVETGKRARTETSIARGTASVSHAAVEMAVDSLGNLADHRVLVLGAGAMGEGTAVALAAAGAGEVLVSNRTAARAEELAARVGGVAVDIGRFTELLCEVDVVVAATGSPDYVLDRDTVAAATAVRRGRPLLLVDVAMPRDVAPDVAELEGVELLDMDDLRCFADRGVAAREREVIDVRGLVAEEVERFFGVQQARRVTPLVIALRARAEDVRRDVLDRHGRRLAAFDEDEREVVDQLTRRLMATLLHEPTVRLKDAAGTPRGERLADTVAELFGL
ncbi:MAG: glutamyl-tRNA reductase [Actinomycetota bacterium]|nr:glutamyl-tRNA reductase [Actinomycetota bacterium]